MIRRLTAATPLDRARLGGKGCGLVRLIRAGFEVPATWYLAPAADGAGEDEPLRQACASLWCEIVAQDPAATLAVRSSATVEDLASASAAGLYRTHLGVAGSEPLYAAVIDCRRSLDGGAVRAYRDRHPAAAPAAMAVLVQRMVAADVAGVLFTANPQRPFADELVIAAGRGLGESVVGATADTDLVVIDRRDRGVVDARRGCDCLDEELVSRLCALAELLERRLGPRLDCEWALRGDRLYLLQERPLVGLPPREPGEVWSRKFGDEYLAGYTTPLTQTLLLPWITDDYLGALAGLMGRRDLAGRVAIRNHRGYQYFSGRYLATMLRVVPPRRRAAHTQGWFPPSWQRQIALEPFVPHHLLTMLAAPLRDRRRATLGGNLRALERHRERVERELAPNHSRVEPALSDPEWRRRLARARDLGREHFRILRWGMGVFHPLLHAALHGLVTAVAADQGERLYPALVGGTATDTVAVNRELWQLGRTVEHAPTLVARLASGGGYSAIRAATSTEPFWDQLDRFLLRHGHRGGSREISEPRWAETPELVLALIRSQIGSPDPDLALARAVAAREAATAELAARIGDLPGGSIRWWVARRLLDRVGDYTRYRENQRSILDRITFELRRLVRLRGGQLAEVGLLTEPDQVFFLLVEELLGAVPSGAGAARLTARIAARWQHYLTHRNRLPATYLFDEVETEGEVMEGPRRPGDGSSGAGIGVSRGVARGRARVVSAVGDLAAVRAGEVLIARNIDPGWTSVFPRVAAIVTETGGMLSHGALLAREYGIPAVMGVVDAARLEGKQVEVDGSTGRVAVIELRPIG